MLSKTCSKTSSQPISERLFKAAKPVKSLDELIKRLPQNENICSVSLDPSKHHILVHSEAHVFSLPPEKYFPQQNLKALDQSSILQDLEIVEAKLFRLQRIKQRGGVLESRRAHIKELWRQSQRSSFEAKATKKPVKVATQVPCTLMKWICKNKTHDPRVLQLMYQAREKNTLPSVLEHCLDSMSITKENLPLFRRLKEAILFEESWQ